jgi:hypothetical protein
MINDGPCRAEVVVAHPQAVKLIAAARVRDGQAGYDETGQ